MVTQVGASRGVRAGRFAVLPLREHIRQSVVDILTTPVGTRVMRPEYGSLLPRLVDRPMNAATKLEIYAAVAEALDRWEPRLALDRVALNASGPGVLEISVEYIEKASGEKISAICFVGGAGA
mgnify:CR=1 FL=1